MSKDKELVEGQLLYHAACIECDSSDATKKRKVHGVGINNADYPVTRYDLVDDKRVQVWMCPYYNQWKHILERGYSLKFKERNPAYLLARVSEKWHLFSNFKQWMEKQNWENMELDKDILIFNNLEYSEDSCCFVPKRVNNLLLDRFRDRGDYPLGVHFNSEMKNNKYIATISHNGKRIYLGAHSTPEKAHIEWQKAKCKSIKDVICWWETDIDSRHTYQKNVASKLLEIAEKLWKDSQSNIITTQL